EGAFSEDSATASLTVDPVNDAPELAVGVALHLNAIAEDVADVDNVGTLISALLASGSAEPITDVDEDALRGIALIGVDASDGRWEYSLDDGAHWTAVGAVAPESALLLAADEVTRLRFVPDLDYNGTLDEAITFRAWDRTSGDNGDAETDASVYDPEGAFSE